MSDDPRKSIEATPPEVFGTPNDRSEESTIAQWRAASDSLKRFNEALLRIGEAEAEAIARFRPAE